MTGLDRNRASALAGVLLLVVAACDGAADDANGERGELGNGTFDYECFGVTDVACRSWTASFRSGIAVGGRFELVYDPGKGITPNVIPASDGSLGELPGGFRMLRPGYAALFAVDGNRQVVDLIHVRGATIDEVRVSVDEDLPAAPLSLSDEDLPVAHLSLSVDDERVLSAIPMDEFDVILVGALDYEWLSQDESILEVETLDDVHRARIRAVGEGEVDLVVRVGEVEHALPIEVSGGGATPPAPDEPTESDAGAAEFDAGSDSSDAAVASDGGQP